jgi:hypothetical protein
VERSLSGGEIRDLGEVEGFPQDVSPDGTQLLVRAGGIVAQKIIGPPEERGPKRLTTDPDRELTSGHSFSPDGRWVVYRTSEGIFVHPFPGPGLRQRSPVRADGCNGGEMAGKSST